MLLKNLECEKKAVTLQSNFGLTLNKTEFNASLAQLARARDL